MFLKDILRLWVSCVSTKAILSYRNDVLWKNSHIRPGDARITFYNWYNSGISYIKDKFNDTANTFYSFDRHRQIYSRLISYYLKYLTILHSIPKRWKTSIRNENEVIPTQTIVVSQWIKAKQTNKFAYNVLKKTVEATDKRSEQKRAEQFGEIKNELEENLYCFTLFNKRCQITKLSV